MGSAEITASGCACGGSCDSCAGSLPDAPDCAIHYHFGMLLGVEDFRAEQGFHLGHARRHQRALHGYGVVYGYAVEHDAAKQELKVLPGLAVDRRGRDLALDAAQCLSLPAWWDKHRNDDAFAELPNLDDVTLDLEVVLCYASCLSRPVPAIADPCAGDNQPGIAYSRICEAPSLSLRRAQPAAAASAPPYRLLRVLLGLAAPEPADSWLSAAQADIAALPPDERAPAQAALWQAVLARATAHTADPLDALADDDPGCLVLARLHGLHLFKDAQGWQSSLAAAPDIDQRPNLLPSQLLQTALLRPGVAAPGLPLGGPRLKPGGLSRSGTSLRLDFDQDLAAASVSSSAFSVQAFGPAGWSALAYSDPPSYSPASRRVTLNLSAPVPVDASLIRVTVRGSGPTPLLGADLLPAGAPSPDQDGLDISTQIAGS